MLPLLNFFFAALLWVQVPQWSDDWSHCAVDVLTVLVTGMLQMLTILSVKVLIGRPLHGIVLKVCKILQIFMIKSSKEETFTQLSHYKNETPEEAEYLCNVLEQTSNYAIARGEQVDFSTVSHDRLKQKNKDYLLRLKW